MKESCGDWTVQYPDCDGGYTKLHVIKIHRITYTYIQSCACKTDKTWVSFVDCTNISSLVWIIYNSYARYCHWRKLREMCTGAHCIGLWHQLNRVIPNFMVKGIILQKIALISIPAKSSGFPRPCSLLKSWPQI